MENIENIVLEYLRHIRGRVDKADLEQQIMTSIIENKKINCPACGNILNPDFESFGLYFETDIPPRSLTICTQCRSVLIFGLCSYLQLAAPAEIAGIDKTLNEIADGFKGEKFTLLIPPNRKNVLCKISIVAGNTETGEKPDRRRLQIQTGGQDIADLKIRMTSLEAMMASVKYEVAACFDTDARQQSALDRLSLMVERIERMLELLP